MSRLRPFQTTIKGEVFRLWGEGKKNILVKSPTGSGKTVLVADIVKTVDRASAVIAHRSELVSQMSVALAREGVRHRIIGPDSLRKNCVTLHVEKLGCSMYDPGGRVGVCGVDTLVKREMSSDSWFRAVGLWAQDEAHHVLKANKWGEAALMFPNAWGLGPTATPARADGKGLGSDNDGLFDAMVEGPEMRALIDDGFLTDYRIFAPPSDVDYSEVTVTSSGDYSPAKLRAAVHASDSIVGDVVRHYLQIARGKRGITFAVDVDAAKQIAAAFNAAGVPAEIVSDKTPALLRANVMRRFEAGEVLQVVNVDLFGEGTDVPAVEVVSMVRKTESWPLFVQQFGRALRLMISDELAARWGDMSPAERKYYISISAKPCALIIDHVGNVIRHGLPDAPRKDTLDRRSARSSGATDAIPLRSCLNPNMSGSGIPCASVYPRYKKVCPFCGFYPEPAARTAPEFVDGDLFELDPATLAAMRGQIERIDGAARIPQSVSPIAAAGIHKQHLARQTAQHFLREQIALWAGWQTAQGFDTSEIYRRFYHAFGDDILTVQSYGRPEAEALSLTIKRVLDAHGVIAA